MILKVLSAIDTWIGKLSVWALTFCLLLMMFLTLANIVFRLSEISVLWVEPFARQLVFVCGFLGGAVATAAKQHIAIDVLGRVLEINHMERSKVWVERLVYSFCIFALVWLAYAGYLLVEQERIYGSEQFLGIHSSTLAAIIPVGAAIITYRFFYLIVVSFSDAQEGT